MYKYIYIYTYTVNSNMIFMVNDIEGIIRYTYNSTPQVQLESGKSGIESKSKHI